VGANVGTHAVGLASAFRRVLAFEANPATALVAKANVLAAGAWNVEVHSIGLSDDNRDAVLSMPNPHAFSWASVTPTGLPGIGIKLKQGDQYLANFLDNVERVGVIKIDVEGHEPEVLSGLRSTLITQKPIVAFEALDETAKKRSIELLKSLGYCSFLGVSTRTRPLLQRIWGLMKARKVYLEEISVGTGYSCVIALPHHAGDSKSKATSAGRV
jgi:FkbM family methyltransferase